MDYTCVLCDRYFGSKGALDQHQQNSPVHTKTIYCKTCDRYFGNEEAFEQHQQNSPVHTKTIYCKTCDRYFGSEEALEQHQQNSPVHTKTIYCKTCDRYFGNEEALEQHQQSSPVHKKSFYCQTCSCFLSSNKALKRHRRDFQVYGNCSEDRPDVVEPTQETREYFMFPSLHQNVAKAVFPEISSTWFHEDENDNNFHDKWLTHVMGKFTCNNSACGTNLWVSKMVTIEIRGYAGNGYNAVVYNQRCKKCDCLGNFVLNGGSYIERVAYRLKKWAGVRMALVYYDSKEGLPHKREFCEGCKRGKCWKENRSVVY
jgi:ribosomal protein S26